MALRVDAKVVVAIALVGVIALGAGGWYGWQYFNPPPPPVQIAPEKVIQDIINVSGMGKAVEELSEQAVRGFAASLDEQGDLPPNLNRQQLEKAFAEAFAARGFKKQIAANLKKNFDQSRMEAFLADISTPLARKMTALEQKQPSPNDLQQFFVETAAKPMPESRASLIGRLDRASHASDFMIEMNMVMMEGMAVGAGATFEEAADELETTRREMEQPMRDSLRMTLAYVYRDVPDKELADYVKLYEKETSKWVSMLMTDAMTNEMRAASKRFGASMAKILAGDVSAAPAGGDAKGAADAQRDVAAKDTQTGKDVVAQKDIVLLKTKPPGEAASPAGKTAQPLTAANSETSSDQSESAAADKQEATAADAPAPQAAAPAQRKSRAHLDARECLNEQSNENLIRCAERFR